MQNKNLLLLIILAMHINIYCAATEVVNETDEERRCELAMAIALGLVPSGLPENPAPISIPDSESKAPTQSCIEESFLEQVETFSEFHLCLALAHAWNSNIKLNSEDIQKIAQRCYVNSNIIRSQSFHTLFLENLKSTQLPLNIISLIDSYLYVKIEQ